MTHVFISYVRENSEIVDRLAAKLRELGIRAWLDRDEILPGHRWKDAIKRAINDGNFFIAYYSKELIGKRRSYMNSELRLAVDILREHPHHPSVLSDRLLTPRIVA